MLGLRKLIAAKSGFIHNVSGSERAKRVEATEQKYASIFTSLETYRIFSEIRLDRSPHKLYCLLIATGIFSKAPF